MRQRLINGCLNKNAGWMERPMNEGHLKDLPLVLEVPVHSWVSVQGQQLC